MSRHIYLFIRAGATELKPTATDDSLEEMMTAITGGGKFELGCTSANGGMEENFHQQHMMMAMPQLPGLVGGYGFEFGGTSVTEG